MARKAGWEARIGRRLPLRGLHILTAVVEDGSMAKAAARLGVSQPSVSEAVAELERVLGVRLLDRSPRGVEPTLYARALLARSKAAFDELSHAVRDIESLADPGGGQLRIGCPESISSSILPGAILRFAERYPRALVSVDSGSTESMLGNLLERKLDFVLARGGETLADETVLDRLHAEVLFHDKLVVVAGMRSTWSRLRKIDLAALRDARWILSAPGTWNHLVVREAFRARGLDMPAVRVSTLSIHLRANLVAAGSAITAFPHSVLQLYGPRFSLKALPVELPLRPWPVTVVTLKDRTLSPIVERFIDCTREVARSFAGRRAPSRAISAGS